MPGVVKTIADELLLKMLAGFRLGLVVDIERAFLTLQQSSYSTCGVSVPGLLASKVYTGKVMS